MPDEPMDDDKTGDLLWQEWASAGHLDLGHDGWSFDPDTRILTCECGTVIPLPEGIPA